MPRIFFGQNKHTNKDWIEENINVLLPLLKTKRQAHVDYQHEPSCTSQNRLRETIKKHSKTVRKCATEFLLKASGRISY